MDPFANITEQRQLADALIQDWDHNHPIQESQARRLAELVVALDEWRRRGGFDPYARVA